MLYREIFAVCSQIHTKHINTLCGQNVELLNVKFVVPKVKRLTAHIYYVFNYLFIYSFISNLCNDAASNTNRVTSSGNITINRNVCGRTTRRHRFTVQPQQLPALTTPLCRTGYILNCSNSKSSADQPLWALSLQPCSPLIY